MCCTEAPCVCPKACLKFNANGLVYQRALSFGDSHTRIDIVSESASCPGRLNALDTRGPQQNAPRRKPRNWNRRSCAESKPEEYHHLTILYPCTAEVLCAKPTSSALEPGDMIHSQLRRQIPSRRDKSETRPILEHTTATNNE